MKKRRNNPLKWIIWLFAVGFYFYEYLIRVFPSVITEDLIGYFHINTSGIGILSAFYLYAYAPMQLPVGALMDRYGARRLLTFACLICGVATLFFSVTDHVIVADISRFFMGIGSAFGFIGMIYVCSHWFSGKKLALMIGLGNSIGMLGAVFGLAFLSYLFQVFPWKDILYALGIIGIALTVLIYLVMKTETASVTKQDPKNKISTKESCKLVLSNGQTWVNAIVAFLYYVTTASFAGMWATPFFKDVHNLSNPQAGFCSSMLFLGWIVFCPIIGHLSDKFENRKIFLLTLPLVSMFLLVFLIFSSSIPFYLIAISMFFVGMGSSAQLLNFSLAIELNPERTKGFAVAFTNFLAFVYGAIIQTLIGYFLVVTGNNYQVCLLVFPISFLLGFILCFFIKEKRHISHITYQ